MIVGFHLNILEGMSSRDEYNVTQVITKSINKALGMIVKMTSNDLQLVVSYGQHSCWLGCKFWWNSGGIQAEPGINRIFIVT